MDSSFPTVDEVRATPPAELAVLLSTLTEGEVLAASGTQAEAIVVATQRVASFMHALQAAAVDRFAELVVDEQEAHAAELRAVRDAQRDRVEAAGGTWRGGRGALSLPEPEQVAASSLAPLLRISPRTMRTRLNRARALMELPRTFALALSGDLEPWRVDAVVVASRDVAADRLAELEARLYATDVTDLPKPGLADRVRRAAAKADPEGVAAGSARAPRRRSLRVAPSETLGLMRWTLELPDEPSQRLFAAVDELAQEYLLADQHLARAGTGTGTGTGEDRERRTVEAARLDALVDLAMSDVHVETVVELVVPVDAGRGALVARPDLRDAAVALVTRPSASDRAKPRPQPPPHAWAEVGAPGGVEVVGGRVGAAGVLVDLVLGNVTHETLGAGGLERSHGLRLGSWLEVDANPFLSPRPPTPPPPDPRDGDDQVWFVDGLVQAPGADALLPSAVIALLSHPDTTVRVRSDQPGSADGTRRQRRRYRPGKALAARVRARDGHCRFPGCSVPAARCQLDHVVPHPQGATEEANLHCLCPAHHGFKHHAGWRLAMTAEGLCSWTAPTGRTHLTLPASARDLAA